MFLIKSRTSLNRRLTTRAQLNYDRSSNMQAIGDAAKSIQESFSATSLNRILHQGGLTVPVIPNAACQNLLNVIATNMTGMSDEEIQFLSDGVFKLYVEILAR